MGLTLNSLPRVKPFLPPNSFIYILSFIGHVIYGTVAAWTYVKLANLNVSKNTKHE